MAFGAVATGNIKAQEADKVAGIITNSTGISALIAVAAKIGSTKVVVAKFELSSVKNVIQRQIKRIST